jgi:dihydrofolate reductase
VSKRPRTMIAALQMSLDGYVQGANGEVDWVQAWNDALDLIPDVDAAVIGGGTYPGYEQLWGSIAADPQSGTAMLGREATEGEVEYARWTQRTPHYVLSTTLDTVNWETARLMRDVSELRSLKEQPGGAIYVIGGAALVSSLMNEGLIDEFRLIVHPIILGGGKALFAGVRDRQALELVQSHAGRSGRVVLTYRI